ncbi:MAG: SGNH/GDSL hydrolase family protein [Clostridia bacterium]|nr:SGNH/GDSL hydrolase family protein [Clostridia bacterium]
MIEFTQTGDKLTLGNTKPVQFSRDTPVQVTLTDDTFASADDLSLNFVPDDGRRHSPARVELARSATDSKIYTGVIGKAAMLQAGMALVALGGIVTSTGQVINTVGAPICINRSVDPEEAALAEPATLSEVIDGSVDAWIAANGIPVDDTLSLAGKPADAAAVGTMLGSLGTSKLAYTDITFTEQNNGDSAVIQVQSPDGGSVKQIELPSVQNVSQIKEEYLANKVNLPTDDEGNIQNGTSEQILATNGDGTTQWVDKPEGVEDGSIAKSSLSNDLLKELGISGVNKETEVKINVVRCNYSSFYDGTEINGSGTSTVLFKTPQKIKIVNNHNTSISVRSIRFADTDDYSNAVFTDAANTREAYFGKVTVDAGESLTFETKEYGRKVCEYIQLSWQPSAWNNAWNNIEVYAIYDSVFPKMAELPKENALHLIEDVPMKWFAMGIKSANYIGVYCAVPYFPDTTYYLRGGSWEYKDTIIYAHGLADDWPINNFVNGYDSDVDGKTAIYKNIAVGIAKDSDKTPYYDKSLQWVSLTTPSEDEMPYCKWLIVRMYTSIWLSTDSENYTSVDWWNNYINNTMAEGKSAYFDHLNNYISLHNEQIPRRINTIMVFPCNDPSNGWWSRALMAHSFNPLNGATWDMFGDSISDAYGGHDLGSDYFMAKIAKEFNMTINNRAIGGTNIYAGGGGNYTADSGIVTLNAFFEKIDSGEITQPDYITVAFGGNQRPGDIGNPDDTSEDYTASTYGATRYFIEKIREKCPDSILGFILPYDIDWSVSNQGGTHDVDGGREAMLAVCKEYRVPYINLYTESGITPDMLPDGVHPSSDTAQKRLYHAIRKFMMGL